MKKNKMKITTEITQKFNIQNTFNKSLIGIRCNYIIYSIRRIIKNIYNLWNEKIIFPKFIDEVKKNQGISLQQEFEEAKHFIHLHPNLKALNRHIRHVTKYEAVHYKWINFGQNGWKFVNIGEILVSRNGMKKLKEKK